MSMTQHQYMLYSMLYDAHAALRASGEQQDLTLTGSTAGAALRTWAGSRKVDVVPETLESVSVGGSWTVLRATMPDDHYWSITIHLDDLIPAVGAVIEASTAADSAASPVDLEIPF